MGVICINKGVKGETTKKTFWTVGQNWNGESMPGTYLFFKVKTHTKKSSTLNSFPFT